ncbi:MAG TPA: hypothetical protein VFH91_10210 [Pyrinomonadaceae bacterium]|nr:hypothetical protein [Pyrinomonadaceae bacterium]
MKYLILPLLFVLTAISSLAQSSKESASAPGLDIIRFSWSKERIGWQRDPFSGPIENFQEVQARTRNERRVQDAKRGGGPEVDKIKTEAKADAANIATQHKTVPARYVFMYKLTVKNSSSKTIKSIDWDYVFLDRATGSELGRREFTSVEKVSPGKSKELTVVISKPPTQTVSLTALNSNERDAMLELVSLVRIEYTDGTAWQRP